MGLDVNEKINGRTLLVAAIENNQPGIVEILLDAGADANQAVDEKTPLVFAAGNGYVHIMELLVDAGARVDAQTTANASALCRAAWHGQVEAIKWLLDAGADIHRPSGKAAVEPFGCAALGEDGVQSMSFLLEQAELNIEMTDASGRTPLMLAVDCAAEGQGCQDNVVYLIRLGANVNAVDSIGDKQYVIDYARPKDAATAKYAITVMNTLINHGAALTPESTDWYIGLQVREVFHASAPAVLTCFHPSQSLVSKKMSNYATVGATVGRVDGHIVMQGLIDNYTMMLKFYYDVKSGQIKVEPGSENTWAPANPECGLREWTSLSSVSAAADQAIKKLIGDAVMVAGMVSAAVFEDTVGACVVDLLVGDAISAVDKDGVRLAVSAAWHIVKRETTTAGEIARDVAVSEMMRVLERENPDVATLLKAGDFVSCLNR